MIPQEQWKTWRPSPDQIRAAKTVFLAMAYTETIRPVVKGYQKQIKREMHLDPDAPSYLMAEADFKTYLVRCNEERIRAGLHVDSEEYCPLLVAEDLERQAKNALIDAMEPTTGISFNQIIQSSNCLENLKKYIDLTLRMMAGHLKTK